MPGDDIPQIGWFDKINGDKLVHFGIFLMIIISWAFSLSKRNMLQSARLKWLLVITVLGIIYGVSIEFIQEKYIPHRSFDIGDIIADTIGCIAGYISARKLFVK